MLARLSIRDIVLIERLDIDFVSGLSVLTGETGAGKSILLDAFALALGARGDAGLVRHGAEQGQVTASFDVAPGHPVWSILSANDIAAGDELILRRVQLSDGRTRAFINDQPVSVQVLKSLGTVLVEIHGQHDERALVDVATHRMLLDAYGGLETDVAETGRAWSDWRAAVEAFEAHRARVEQASREADWLRHAVEELKRLAPTAGEETALAARRTAMMQAEKVAGDLRDAHDAVAAPSNPSTPRSTRSRTRAGISRRRCAPPTTTRANWSASRSACSRCGRPGASTTSQSTTWRRSRRATPPISRRSMPARRTSADWKRARATPKHIIAPAPRGFPRLAAAPARSSTRR